MPLALGGPVVINALALAAFCNGRKGCATLLSQRLRGQIENLIGDRWNGHFGDLRGGKMSLLRPSGTHSAPVQQSFEISISVEELFLRHG